MFQDSSKGFFGKVGLFGLYVISIFEFIEDNIPRAVH